MKSLLMSNSNTNTNFNVVSDFTNKSESNYASNDIHYMRLALRHAQVNFIYTLINIRQSAHICLCNLYVFVLFDLMYHE